MSPPSAGAHIECSAASQHGRELSSSLPKALLLLPSKEQAQICAAASLLQAGSAASTGKWPGQGAPGLHLCAYAGRAAAVQPAPSPVSALPSTRACQQAAPLSAAGAAAFEARLPGSGSELRRRAEEPAPQRIRAVYRPSALPASARGAAAAAGRSPAAGGDAAAPAEESVDASAGSGASLGSSSESSDDVKPAGRTRALWGGAAPGLQARHPLTAYSGPRVAGAVAAMR